MHFAHPVLVTVFLSLVMSAVAAVPAQAATIEAPAPTANPYSPMAGESFALSGDLGVDPDPTKRIYLWRLDSGKWKRLADTDANDRAYSFANQRISVSSSFRVTAYTPGGDTILSATRYVRVASQYAKLVSVERVCNLNNDCQNTAKATGYVKPARTNRTVYLQGLTSQGWKTFTGVTAKTEPNGAFTTNDFGIGTWSQWSARKLRIVAGRFAGSTYAVSAPITFMPGPTKLGDNVLRVDVDGGSFPAKKGVEYKGYATLIKQGSTTPIISRARLDNFGVRGSTTSGYPKKPYNFRFDQPPSVDVFGMDADRRWTLLAMYADQSYVRDKTALDLGRKLAAKGGMSWNPDSRYVELFVNSLYMGAYLMTEKVDIDSDKVDVDKDTGMIMEVDMDTVSDPRKGFQTSLGGLVFAFKEPDSLGGSEGITSGKLSAIKNKLAGVESYLYSSSKRNYYHQHIDRNSAADFHLAVEYFKDIDSDFWRSKYFTWDTTAQTSVSKLRDRKLHFGPLWDFDKSIGNVDPTNPGTAFTRSYRGWQANGTGVGKDNRVTFHTHWFVQLWKVPLFRKDLTYRWNNILRDEFWRAAKYDVDQNKAEIGWGAANDRRRWAGSAKLYRPKGSSYDDEVKYVKYWLLNRFSWMDSQL